MILYIDCYGQEDKEVLGEKEGEQTKKMNEKKDAFEAPNSATLAPNSPNPATLAPTSPPAKIKDEWLNLTCIMTWALNKVKHKISFLPLVEIK
jgi:hypothetical protein